MFTSVRFQLLCWLITQRRLGDRHQSSQGFTLIELLVVIIIIGILSAIASVSFLDAATKAKGAEARANISAILKVQQQYYLEQGHFAGNLQDLAVGINELTTNYRYRVHPGTGNDRDINGNQVTVFASAIAIPQTQVRGYMGKVWLDTFNGEVSTKTVLCEGGIGETYFMNGQVYCP
ncbi:MAG: type IV pilin-like G/H family protein [Leptolyngbyaceae bacterium]|nr:type IV pilin-like G/H family protein [Leptolyngbyaceae bacterium]